MSRSIRTAVRKKAPMTCSVVRAALALVMGITLGMVGCAGLRAQQAPVEPVKLTVLFKADIPGAEGKEETIFLVEIAPGASTPRHYHPGQEFAYVLEGSGVLYEEGRPPVTLTPGFSLSKYSSPEKAGYVHWATNTSKTDMQRWLVVLVTEKGYPVLIPVK